MLKKGTPIAKFKLEHQFHITGRGLVLTGQVISGSISAGNSIGIEDGDDLIRAKVLSVEFVRTTKDELIGLMLGGENDHLEPIFDKLIGETLPII